MRECAERKVTITKKRTSRKITALLDSKVQKRVRIMKGRGSPRNSVSREEVWDDVTSF